MATTNLLTDPGHVRGDLKMMETAVSRSIKHPEIPIPDAVARAVITQWLQPSSPASSARHPDTVSDPSQ